MEILWVGGPRIAQSTADSGVTVRILRALKTDAETLRLISDYATQTAGLIQQDRVFQDLQGAA